MSRVLSLELFYHVTPHETIKGEERCYDQTLCDVGIIDTVGFPVPKILSKGPCYHSFP